jgi:hypothetical protein
VNAEATQTVRQLWRDDLRDCACPNGLDALAMAVAFAVDRHMSADGETYTGVRKLARLARVNKDTVTARVDQLVEAGWLQVLAGKGRGGRRRLRVSYPVGHFPGGHCPTTAAEVSDGSGRSVRPGRTNPDRSRFNPEPLFTDIVVDAAGRPLAVPARRSDR